MSVGIWKVKYTQIYNSLSQDEFDFIERNIPCSDDGTYEITKGYLAELRRKFSGMEDLGGLIKGLDKYVKSGKGYLSFRIF